MKPAPSDMEGELARLWDAEALTPRASRFASATLVTFVSDPRLLEDTLEAVARLGQAVPCRAITVLWQPSVAESGEVVLEIEVALQRAPGGRALGDWILFRARGAAGASVVSRVESLLLAGVPVCVWWVGAPGPLMEVWARLGERAGPLVIDSAAMRVRDFETLSSIALVDPRRRPLADLGWARLEPMRDLVARFFDEEVLVPHLDELSRATIAYAPHPDDADIVSAEGALFVGWLAAVLGLRTESVSWTRASGGDEAIVRRRLTPQPVAVRVKREPQAGVPHGTLLSVQLVCPSARFVVAREPYEPSLVSSSCEAPGANVPAQLSRVELRDLASLLAPRLRSAARDRMFEASLDAAREMFLLVSRP